MALTFLPVRTPSTVGILVLTLDKYLQSEIELALHEYQHVFFASNANEASSILADDQIGVVVIDVSTLESDDRDLISEMLTFFPELILVSFVETGSTHNLVALSEKYDIYRYLKIPCARKQIANCVTSAVKKYLKQYGNKDVESDDHIALPAFLGKNNIAIISTAAVAILLILIFLVTESGPSPEKQQPSAKIQQDNTDNNIAIPAREEVLSIIGQILLNARNAFEAGDYYDPENSSALFYYIKALNLEPKNQEAITGLKMVLNLMVDNINTSLKDEKYQHAVTLSNILVKTLPNSSLTEPLLKHLSEQGMILVAQAKQLADNGEPDSANATLTNAVILLGQNHDEISAAESYISSTTSQSSQINEFLEKARLRLSSNNLTKPADDSAKFYLLSLQKISPENSKVSPLLIELVEKLLGHANTAIDKNSIPKAKYFLQEAKALGVKTKDISNLEAKINSQKETEPAPAPAPISEQKSDSIQERIEKQEKINGLLIVARKSYSLEQYFEPENNNASYYLLLAKKIDPSNEDITYSLNELADKTLLIIQNKLADKNMTEVSALINHIKRLGVRTKEIEKLEQEVN